MIHCHAAAKDYSQLRLGRVCVGEGDVYIGRRVNVGRRRVQAAGDGNLITTSLVAKY
jgi:hypothetical protein